VGTLDEDTTEHNASMLLAFHAVLKIRNYASLNMELGIFQDETHMSAVLPRITLGLRSIFG
jgi:hypothetical protein